MINNTKHPILVSNTLTASELDKEIRASILEIIDLEITKHGGNKLNPPIKDNQNLPTFTYFFFEELKRNNFFDFEWLCKCFIFTQDTSNPQRNNHHIGLEDLLQLNLKKYKRYIAENNSSTCRYLVRSKSELKHLLLNLWVKNIFLFPINSRLGTSLDKGYVERLLINKECALYAYTHKLNSIRTRGFRIFLASDWNTVEDINMHEYASLHRLTLQFSNTDIDVRGIARWPFIPLLKELIDKFNSRTSHLKINNEIYQRWTRGGYYEKYDLEYFKNNLEMIMAERHEKYNKRKKEEHRSKMLQRYLGEHVELIGEYSEGDTYKTIHLREIAKKNNHEAAAEYFLALAHRKRFSTEEKTVAPNSQWYPGREHISYNQISKYWEDIFQGFMNALTYMDDVEQMEGFKGALNILRDYLYLYLPWYFELFPNSQYNYPLNPAEFERHTFWRRTKHLSNAPLTLYELLKRRREGGGVGAVVSTIKRLFDYINIANIEFDFLINKQLLNPISIEFDYPSRRGSHKTNKLPFSKEIIPYLIRYLYAIEDFGIFLQNTALNHSKYPPLPNSRGIQSGFMDPYKFGHKLTIEFNGTTFPVNFCPPAFIISKRNIKNNRKSLNLNIAHLSAVRMCIVAIETGLRFQSIQWLDRDKWDSLNQNSLSDQSLWLYVNTDKTREKPWKTPISRNAYNVLKREEQFQLSIDEPQMDVSFPYEYREKSRFEDLIPLFRGSSTKGNVVDDKAYHKAWLELMAGFQIFYNKAVLPKISSNNQNQIQFVEILPKVLGNKKATFHTNISGEKQVNERVVMENSPFKLPKPDHSPAEDWPEKVSSTLLSYYAIHTPHSARSTYVSSRSSLLEVADIQKLVGHQNQFATLHYLVESDDEVFERAEKANKSIFNYTSDKSRVYLHPELPDSPTRKAIQTNLDEAISSFGLQIITLLNEEPEPNQDGIALLRTTAAARLEFQSTHICVTGGQCPKEIMDIIFQPRRCGLCPIAVKGIDHLTGIAAKMNQLVEQIYNANQLLNNMRPKINKKQIREIDIKILEEQRRWDVNELVGWKRAYELLQLVHQKRMREEETDSSLYSVDKPEIVKRHLMQVVQSSEQTKFIFDRIIDSEAYPNLETPELRAKADQFKRKLLINAGMISEALESSTHGDEIEELRHLIISISRTLNCSPQQLIEEQLLNQQPKIGVSLTNTRLLTNSIDF